MRYLLLVYANSANWGHPTFQRSPEFLALPEDEREALTRQAEILHREIVESGELVTGVALDEPAAGIIVRAPDGVLTVTDGPFAETKEHFAGYFVLDCASPERATEIASRIPDARFAAVEVRPIVETSLDER